jgi:alpha-ketoglutarate-dependent taurine dioxygenase
MKILIPGDTLIEKNFFSGDVNDLLSSIENIGLELVPTTTGIISTVQNEKGSYDWNKLSEDFYFHQDGSHLPVKPEYVALLCVHPGDGNAMTAFTDARKIYKELLMDFSSEFLSSLLAVYIDKNKTIYKRYLVEKNDAGENFVNTFHFLEPDTEILKESDRRILNMLLLRLLISYERLQKENVFYSHRFQRGDLLIFRNRECHHSRTGMSEDDNDRFLYRIWLSRRA